MGFQTQSVQSGQAYPMASVNAVSGIGETSLARQMSIYSLTLEEFQNTLGEPSKSFGSMNMDELFQNIWTAEESQAMLAAVGTVDGSVTGLPKQASLCRQGSTILRNTLGQKTVDEVWKSIYQEHNDMGSSKGGQQRAITFGEITLEDFLMKAGVVRESGNAGNQREPSTVLGGTVGMDRGGQFGAGISTYPPPKTVPPSLPVVNGTRIDAMRVVPLQPADLFNGPLQKSSLQLQQQQHGQLSQPPGTAELGNIYSNCGRQAGNCSLVTPAVGLGGLGSPVGGGIAASLNTGLCYGYSKGTGLNVTPFQADSPYSPSIDGAVPSHDNLQLSPTLQPLLDVSINLRKRPADAQRAMERRQRRMIKNRESAARSRARKQAYTDELEDEVTQLKAENLKLRQKQEEAEERKKQVMAIMPGLSRQAQNERKCLRRTRTTP